MIANAPAADELVTAKAIVDERRRELKAAERELSEWMDSRLLGGLPAKSINLNSNIPHLVDAMAVDRRHWESKEGMLRASVEGARARLNEAESQLHDLRLRHVAGQRIRIQLLYCVTAAGDELVSPELIHGEVFGVLGPLAGIRLDRPTMFRAKSIEEVFAPIVRLMLD